MGEGRGAIAAQILADQLTLSQPGLGVLDYAQHITPSPGFLELPMALKLLADVNLNVV